MGMPTAIDERLLTSRLEQHQHHHPDAAHAAVTKAHRETMPLTPRPEHLHGLLVRQSFQVSEAEGLPRALVVLPGENRGSEPMKSLVEGARGVSSTARSIRTASL
jgi:hypothetical protein